MASIHPLQSHIPSNVQDIQASLRRFGCLECSPLHTPLLHHGLQEVVGCIVLILWWHLYCRVIIGWLRWPGEFGQRMEVVWACRHFMKWPCLLCMGQTICVKDSGFSPNPYSSHFLFFSIYSSYFSFMHAFAVSQCLLWLLWCCDCCDVVTVVMLWLLWCCDCCDVVTVVMLWLLWCCDCIVSQECDSVTSALFQRLRYEFISSWLFFIVSYFSFRQFIR